nr:lipopolysaccharide-induced tumor necrosis factor-alpha factor homolog [Ciona intestinalis]|eukprot:XP_002131750.1 lipopolysaccharide-induced tumor necrosis factor-alpha factor homolog [Ciona intestinalis]
MAQNQPVPAGYPGAPPAYTPGVDEKSGMPLGGAAYPQQPGYPQAQPGFVGQPVPPGQPGAPMGQPGAPMGPPPAGYVPPPPGQAYGMPTQTVIIQQQFSQAPTACTCPNCHQSVVTRTVAETSMLTWLIAGGIILLGGWIFCLCFIPFCIDDLKDVRHQCPNCNHTIHIYKRA